MRHQLPCGCYRDGSRVCDDHAGPVRNGIAGLVLIYALLVLIIIAP